MNWYGEVFLFHMYAFSAQPGLFLKHSYEQNGSNEQHPTQMIRLEESCSIVGANMSPDQFE